MLSFDLMHVTRVRVAVCRNRNPTGLEMIEESTERNELAGRDEKAAYQRPEFDVVSLALITLQGSGTGDDGGGKDSGDLETGNSDDEYDEDPMGDPWGSRGGGG